MASIYLIEDINDMKYVGSTTQKYLNSRLCGHRCAYRNHKNIGNYCSSSKLNLYNCIIIELERCNIEDRKERERYWINEIDCVNQLKLNFDKEKLKEYQKEWHEKNIEKRKEQREEHYQKNKDKINQRHKEYYQKNKDKINQRHREYREKNKDKIKQYNKEYYQTNKDN